MQRFLVCDWNGVSRKLMDSTQLIRFSDWYPFDKDGVGNAPREVGVYVIRKVQGERFGRLKGESDILYIGSTLGIRGLRGRLQRYFHTELRGTDLRINQLTEEYGLEVAWWPTEEYARAHAEETGDEIHFDSPRNFEYELLLHYLKEHGELPPLNRAGIHTLYMRFETRFMVTGRVKRSKKKD